MEVDDEQYPLTTLTTLATYMDLKPPEKSKKPIANTTEEDESNMKDETNPKKNKSSTYRKYKKEDMEKFYFLVLEKGMSIRGAAKELNLPATTAQSWYKRGMESLEKGEDLCIRKTGSGRPVGRPPKLSNEHRDYLVQIIDEKPSIVLDEMMEKLTSEFEGLNIARSNLHKFITTSCRISLKRAHFQPEERNCEAKIEERFQWVTELLKTDVDYLSNCVFIDESGFNINLKRAMAWAPVGETPVVKTPKTKAKSHTIIGAISALGVVNMQLKVPKVVAPTPSKKRKGPGGTPKKLE
ncbi:hypothetical protein, partial, partial [Parasitella parasitica]